MATRTELINGYDILIQEARRVASALEPNQWALAVDQDGWKGTEVLAHVAGVGTLVVPLVNAALNAPAGTSILDTGNIDTINAGIVGARAGKSAAELAEETASAYGAVIDWVKAASDETLAQHVTIGGYADVPLSDVLVRMTILHGLSHVYSVYSAVFMAPVTA
jgi:hypothetical protein